MARVWRVYHPGLSGEAGAPITLSDDEAHHLHRVLRLARGAEVHVFDGAGIEWSAVLDDVSAQGVVARLVAPRTDPIEARLPLALYQGWCRPEHVDLVVQKTTELGVVAVRLFPAERATGGKPSGARLERWRRIAVEACKQCGRRLVPEVELVDELPAVDACAPGWIADPGPGARPLTDALGGPPPGSLALAVGPESGFTADERRRAEDRGWLAVSLGPRTLRAETAAIATVAVLLHAWGAPSR